MKNARWLIRYFRAVCLTLFFLPSLSVAEQPVDPKFYSGKRDTNKGLRSAGAYIDFWFYDGFSIAWDISYDKSREFNPWHYVYTIRNEGGGPLDMDLGRLYLETNQKALYNDFTVSKDSDGNFQKPAEHLTSDFYTIAFTDINEDQVTLDFYSAWSPMWGDFVGYGARSNSTYAYNSGLLTEPSDEDAPFDLWVPAPGFERAALPVPEPRHYLTLGSLLCMAFFAQRCRRTNCGSKQRMYRNYSDRLDDSIQISSKQPCSTKLRTRNLCSSRPIFESRIELYPHIQAQL